MNFSKTNLLFISLFFISITFLINSCANVEIQGKVYNINNKPLQVNVLWQNLATGDTLDVIQNDSLTGEYKRTLSEKFFYGYTFTKKGYFPVFRSIDLRNNNEVYTNEEDIVLTMLTVDEVLAKGTFVVENVFFDNNSRIIKEGSQYSLKAIAKFLIENKISKLEVNGYTDTKGDDTYNIGLSMGRAEAVCGILRGSGCNRVTFIPKGMGKANPVASNDTEAGRAKNRRVEIKLIK